MLNKPEIEQTNQGLTVSYQNRLLYSKYNPSKAIKQTVSNLNYLPGTIFLCLSPVLDYGFNELLESMKEDSIILCCELEQSLYDFEVINKSIPKNNSIAFLTKDEIINLPFLLQKNNVVFNDGTKLKKSGTYKRVVRIDMSAGVQFHSEFYDELYSACVNSILTYWANRVTLTKFGRRYSMNFFRNLKLLPQTVPVESFFNSISKPILVCGAGQSLDKTIQEIIERKNDFYILCADTALKPLLKYNIIPDGVFVEEAQHIISKAFIGTLNKNIHLFASLSSLFQIPAAYDKCRVSFFTTVYTQSEFLENLINQNLLPPANNPFGSVGLTVVWYALKFRRNKDVNVFVTGLDFSFSKGLTHTRNAPSVINTLIECSRLKSLNNYASSFGPGSEQIQDKNNLPVYTTHTLKTYANLFNHLFEKTENLFDISHTGLKLNIEHKDITNTKGTTLAVQELTVPAETMGTTLAVSGYRNKQKLENYFKDEINALEELTDLLTNKQPMEEEIRSKKIKELAEPREYLYLHFPDGHSFNSGISFLKRIRSEIDFFLKYLRD